MVPRTYGNAQLIEQYAHIIRVDALHQEGNKTGLILSLAYDTQAFYSAKLFRSVFQQGVFMSCYLIQANAINIINGRSEGYSVSYIRCAGLKLIWQVVIGSF